MSDSEKRVLVEAVVTGRGEVHFCAPIGDHYTTMTASKEPFTEGADYGLDIHPYVDLPKLQARAEEAGFDSIEEAVEAGVNVRQERWESRAYGAEDRLRALENACEDAGIECSPEGIRGLHRQRDEALAMHRELSEALMNAYRPESHFALDPTNPDQFVEAVVRSNVRAEQARAQEADARADEAEQEAQRQRERAEKAEAEIERLREELKAQSDYDDQIRWAMKCLDNRRPTAMQEKSPRDRIRTLEAELSEATGHLVKMLRQVEHIDCVQDCDDGTCVDGYGEPYQCQWCDEQDEARAALEALGVETE